jgi:hypothetical protein
MRQLFFICPNNLKIKKPKLCPGSGTNTYGGINEKNSLNRLTWYDAAWNAFN